MAIGAFIMGMMVESVGYRMIYVAGAVLVVLAGALYAVQMKKRGVMPLVSPASCTELHLDFDIAFALQQQGKISPAG